jgi:chlorobactene glucosyltransferase
MIALALAVAWFAIVALLLCRALRQFGSYETLRPAAEPRPAEAPSLTVIVPARNEARAIERCLHGLLRQAYPGALRVVVVDDGSTDGTASILRRIAATEPRLEPIAGGPLPEGWTGKAYACWQGARAARTEWLCFMDADTAAGPDLLATAVAAARRRELDMLSLQPFQELGTFWERLIIPAGLFVIAFSQDPSRVNDPASPDAAANGQFILIRREAYEAVGGHAAVRAQICEDSSLARRVKRAGYRLAVLGGERLVRVRMYTGLRSLWFGLSKNAAESVGGPQAAVFLAAIGVALAWTAVALPLGLAVVFVHAPPATHAAALGLAVAVSLAVLGMHTAGARRFRIPHWYGPLFPLGYTLLALIALNAVVQRRRGRVAWKGRVYAPPSSGTAGRH